jgi:membrane protease YdiL (CAAX protease family)
VLVVLADYALVSPLVGAGLAIRGAVALLLGLTLARAAPTPPPQWGRVRPSLGWMVRFLAWFTPLAVLVVVAALFTARALGQRWLRLPLLVPSEDAALECFFRAVIAAPIVEELIYRGIVQPRLEAGCGAKTAVFLSGPIFWILHWAALGRVTPPTQLLAGWILARAFLRTRSLLAPTILHALGNLALFGVDLLWYRNPDFFAAWF